MSINKVIYHEKTGTGINTKTLIDLTDASTDEELCSCLPEHVSAYSRSGNRVVGTATNEFKNIRNKLSRLIQPVTNMITSSYHYVTPWIANDSTIGISTLDNFESFTLTRTGLLNLSMLSSPTGFGAIICEVAVPANLYIINNAYIQYNLSSTPTKITLDWTTNTKLSGGGSGYSLKLSSKPNSSSQTALPSTITISFSSI